MLDEKARIVPIFVCPECLPGPKDSRFLELSFLFYDKWKGTPQ